VPVKDALCVLGHQPNEEDEAGLFVRHCVWHVCCCCCCPQVIMLSYYNVKKAMDYYVSKGGTAKFIICDDGFQVRAWRCPSLWRSAPALPGQEQAHCAVLVSGR
jgi:hypothetical protein